MTYRRRSPALLAFALCSLSVRAPAAPGDVDLTFNPAPNGETDTAAVQPDEKIIVAGNFGAVGGFTRHYVARLLADGSGDTAFNPNANAFVRNTSVQPDGKVLITGLFTTMGGVTRNYVARVFPDGTLDMAFNPNASADTYSTAVQPDGRVIIGGTFTSMGGVPRSYLARFQPEGLLDAGFNPGTDANVRTPLVLPDGRILIGGNFTMAAGSARGRVAILKADGTLDPGFNASVDGPVYCTSLQSDGKILIGGAFTAVGAVPRSNLARLLPDGSLDTSFDVPADDIVRSIAVQTDGKIMIAGTFHTVSGSARSRFARLLPFGTLDPAFSATVASGGPVFGVTLQADGKIIIAGQFTSVGSAALPSLARLQNGAATQVLTVEGGSRIQWMRTGTSPETHQVTFEFSGNGVDWTFLGAGTRITNGWELTGQSLPSSGQIRARARTSGGYGGASSGLVESVISYAFDPLETWRLAQFNTTSNTGDAANNTDPDHDGLENLVEFAFGLNPQQPDAAALPAWQAEDDDYVLDFTRPANVGGISYIAEQSTSLEPGSWTAVPNLSTPPHYLYDLPSTAGARRYLRIRVTIP